MRKRITKEEFEQGYAERSGVTVDKLHEMGEGAIPCDCNYKGCQGWQMVILRRKLDAATKRD